MGFFYGAGDNLTRERHIKSVIISSRADFSLGRHFNVTPAAHTAVARQRRQRSASRLASDRSAPIAFRLFTTSRRDDRIRR